MAPVVDEDATPVPVDDVARLDTATKGVVIEALYTPPGWLLHTDGDNLTIVASDYEPILFETLPPTDHDTWEAHRAQLAPYESQRRDPTDLHSWLDAFTGTRSEIAGASLANVRIMDGGFRFELELARDYAVNGPDLLGIEGLAPGEYVVTHKGGGFAVAPLVPPLLSLEVKFPAGNVTTLPLQVNVANSGTGDAPRLVLVAEVTDRDGMATELARQQVDALAGNTPRILLDMPGTNSGSQLHIWLENTKGDVLATATFTNLTDQQGIFDDVIYSLLQVPVLLPVLAGFAVLVAIAAVLAVRAQREGSAV